MIVLEFTEMRPPSFRTILLDIEQAGRWARCLAANARFTNVEIQISRRAKSADVRYFVTWQPASPARQAAMMDRQQNLRARRADEEQFTFCHDGDHDFYHCLSHGSGETYETTLHSCSCPDHSFRCAPNGLACKHQLSLADHIREERTMKFSPVPGTTQRKFDAQRFQEIFG